MSDSQEQVGSLSDRIDILFGNKQVEILQGVLDELFSHDTFTARDALEVLQRNEFKPFLDQLIVGSSEDDDQDDDDSEEDDDDQEDTETADDDDSEGDEPEPEPVKVAAKNKPKGDRTYTIFTAEQKQAQRELIYKIASSASNPLTKSEFIAKVSKRYPDLKPWTISELIKGLALDRHLSGKKKGKVIYYKVGPKPL